MTEHYKDFGAFRTIHSLDYSTYVTDEKAHPEVQDQERTEHYERWLERQRQEFDR